MYLVRETKVELFNWRKSLMQGAPKSLRFYFIFELFFRILNINFNVEGFMGFN